MDLLGLLIIPAIIGAVVWVISKRQTAATAQIEGKRFEDAAADARRWIDRLGGQVLNISGTDAASTQAMADASDRFNAASSQMASATTVRQAELARESALEGLYYVQAAREIMGLPAGPALPPLEGQRKAGQVTERRTITQDGETLTASPVASAETPNYYPGGMVAGRPVPAGWYSRPWWAQAMLDGMWTASSFMLFSSLFNGMSGVGYSADAWQSGYDAGFAEGLGDAGGDFGGDAGDLGGDDGGFFDSAFGDFGGDGDGGFLDSAFGDFSGGDGGGFLDSAFGDFDFDF